jgi:hypothetical protein
MPIRWRRISIMRASVACSKFSPLKTISPAVGSMSRDMQRTSVDLPEPDSPMMTKHSPSRTSSVTSRTAAISRAAPSASGVIAPLPRCAARKPAAPWPNSFHTERHTSFASASGIVLSVTPALPVVMARRDRATQ